MKKKLIISMLVMTLAGSSATAFGIDIEESRNKLNQATEQKRELEEKLNIKSGEVDATSKEIEEIDKQMMSATEELVAAKEHLQKTEEEVEAVKRELAKAEEKLEQKQDQLNSRVNVMYKNTSAGYLEVVLAATDIADLLNRVTMIKDIVSYDSEIITEVKAHKELIIEKSEELEVKKAEAKKATENAEVKKAELEDISNAKVAYMAKLKEDEAAYVDHIATLEAESNEIIRSIQAEEARIAEEARKAEEARQAELARQAEAARRAQEQAAATAQRNNSSRNTAVVSSAQASSRPAPAAPAPVVSAARPQASSSSGMIRPVAGGRISSEFGPRWGTMHNGIDVALPQGTPVVAAADGVVARSHYSSSYGEVVYISHGNGMVTISAHNSRRVVSNGQAVSKGQVIAYSGNTGQSTGPHLHFEVVINGRKINPRNYINF